MLFVDFNPELNATDQAIYDYILSHLETIPYMSIRELSSAVPVSQTSIWRFCKKFQCSGYAGFKFELRNYLKHRNVTNFGVHIDQTALINFMQRTLEPTLTEAISNAAALLKDKEIVIFIGAGSSKIIAEYGATFFSSLFNLSVMIPHPLLHPISQMQPINTKKIGVIALSVSGENAKVINNLSYLSEIGIDSVSITNSANCPIARIATVNIPYYIAQQKNETADITSQVPALFLLERLGNQVARLTHQKITES